MGLGGESVSRVSLSRFPRHKLLGLGTCILIGKPRKYWKGFGKGDWVGNDPVTTMSNWRLRL